MRHTRLLHTIRISLVVLMFPIVATARNVRVVDYGGDMGSGSYRNTQKTRSDVAVDVDGDGETTDDSVAFWKFSLTEPMNPDGILYDTEATNAVFYGGITAYFGAPDKGLVEGLVNENHERRDDFNMMTANTPKPPVNVFGFWFWKKEDFLNGGDRYRVTFDDDSRIVPHISRYYDGIDDSRWVVRDGEQFYVSEKTFSDYQAELGRNSPRHTSYVLHPTQTQWAPYNPQEPYRINLNVSGLDFSNHAFKDVSAMGFIVYSASLREEDVGLKWHSFEAYAVVNKPDEPSFYHKMVSVPAGMFEERAMPSFAISETEVSYALWKRVWKWAVSSQYCFDLEPGYIFNCDGDMGSMDLGASSHDALEPATDMTWMDAVAWCNAFSELEGRRPVYYADATFTNVLRSVQGRLHREDYDDEFSVYVDPEADGFRLPTALEWAYAATGSTGALDFSDRVAWTGANSDGRTHSVGGKTANAFGLKDVAGNVWEYVWDQPEGCFDPAVDNTRTVLGGGFRWPEDRSATPLLPHGDVPWNGSPAIGFRVMRSAGTPVTGPAPTGMPRWSFDQGELIEPGAAPGRRAVVGDSLAYLSGKETYGEPGEGNWEADNLGYQRDDGAFVRVTPFYMGTTEITFVQWNEVYQWAVRNEYQFDFDGDMGSMDWQTGQHSHSPVEPVTQVGWNDAVVWCNALSEYEGLDPVYFSDVARTVVLRESNRWRNRMDMSHGYNLTGSEQVMEVHVRWERNGYRLPTGAEWVIAYRDGLQQQDIKYPWPGGISDAVGRSWVAENSGGRTHPVGLKPANRYGLHDLAGNVTEWTWDWPGVDYYRAHNPKGGDVPNTLFGKLLYGGNFGWKPFSIGQREEEREQAPRAYFGFRVVRCDPGRHSANDAFRPETVLSFDSADFDNFEDRLFRYGNDRRGSTKASGVPLGPVSELWSYATGDAILSSPVVVDGRLIVGGNDNCIHALDAASGKKCWEVDTGGDVIASAVIDARTVYLGGGTRFLAVDLATGEVRWERDFGQKVTVSPALAYGVVFTAFGQWGNSAYVGLNSATGEEVWRFRLGVPNLGPMGPALDGTSLYAPYDDNKVMAASLATEYYQWDRVGHRCRSCLAIVDETTVAYLQRADLKLLDRSTGATRLSRNLGGSFDDKPESMPAVDWVELPGGGKEYRIVVGLLDGSVHCLSVDGLVERWKVGLGGPVRSSATIAHNAVYLGTDDGRMLVLSAVDGSEIWSYDTGARITSSPWVAQGVVYGANHAGRVFALTAED